MLSGCLYNIHQHTGAMNLFRLAWNGWFGTSVCLCALASVCTFLFFFFSSSSTSLSLSFSFRFLYRCEFAQREHPSTYYTQLFCSFECMRLRWSYKKHTFSLHYIFCLFSLWLSVGFLHFFMVHGKKCSSIDVYISNYMYIFPLKRASWYAHIPINECELRRWEERSQHTHTSKFIYTTV